jgi:hypothetical protein
MAVEICTSVEEAASWTAAVQEGRVLERQHQHEQAQDGETQAIGDQVPPRATSVTPTVERIQLAGEMHMGICGEEMAPST